MKTNQNISTTNKGSYEWLFFKIFSKCHVGSLDIEYPDGYRRRIGNKNTQETSALLKVNDRRVFRYTILYGDIGLGEAYMYGMWDSPDVRSVLCWFLDNAASISNLSQSVKGIFFINAPLNFINKILHYLKPNSKRTSPRNIEKHYDLSNEFFSLWLDKNMAYSAGIFTSPKTNLEEAQVNKFETICRKIKLNSQDHLLDIGCGWGGFAVYAAKKYGCKVSAITISLKQFEGAQERVKQNKLEEKITVYLRDYRDLASKYDKIVSIEMVEALGYRYFDTFFKKCGNVLKQNGLMLLQCITFPDPYYKSYLKDLDFIQKHIFPGSLLPCVREILNSLHRTGDLYLYHLESIGQHYAYTLRAWYHNFEEHLNEIRKLGFDETFIRKWRYYLMFCEAGFTTNYINDVQILLSRAQNPTLNMDFTETNFLKNEKKHLV